MKSGKKRMKFVRSDVGESDESMEGDFAHPFILLSRSDLKKALREYRPVAKLSPRKLGGLAPQHLQCVENFLIGDAVLNQLPLVKKCSAGASTDFVFHGTESGHWGLAALTHGETKKVREMCEWLTKSTSLAEHPAFATVADFGRWIGGRGMSKSWVSTATYWLTQYGYDEGTPAWQYELVPGAKFVNVARVYSWSTLEQTFAAFGDTKL